MKKLAVIGQYGEGPAYLTGQAVKTVFIANWMMGRFGADQVEIVNTYGWKKHPLRLLTGVIGAMSRCANVMIFPAQHGVKVFPRLVAALNKLFRRRTFFVVIGGWLADYLQDNPAVARAVKTFDGVLAETETLAAALRAVGVEKASWLPNCRDYVLPAPKTVGATLPRHVCTYSRVTETKGIADAVDIVKKANALLGENVFFLDVFGVVDPAYKDEFAALCEREKAVMAYAGTRKASETLATLQGQFALLFPTYYEGECFAGTALDAFLSATPLIANDWKYNAEVIRHGVDGFLYPYRDTAAAAEYLAALYRDPTLYAAIQKGCGESAHTYSSDVVLSGLAAQMA